MSSIYITGMKMPTTCISCPFMVSREGDDCILQSHEANASFLTWEQMKTGCPLVELPPHGRLVDADALITVMEKCADALKPCTEKLCYNFAAAILREASPIIPADPE